jgi:uncharacterized protein with NAD-binding domain and iron-sulfur cluster
VLLLVQEAQEVLAPEITETTLHLILKLRLVEAQAVTQINLAQQQEMPELLTPLAVVALLTEIIQVDRQEPVVQEREPVILVELALTVRLLQLLQAAAVVV